MGERATVAVGPRPEAAAYPWRCQGCGREAWVKLYGVAMCPRHFEAAVANVSGVRRRARWQ